MKAFQLFVAGLAIGLTGCPTVEPVPPDPNEPVPPVSCDDDGAPISLTRVVADSLQETPGWLQVCTLCPASSIEMTADVPLVGAWTGGLQCAVAFPAEPIPAGALWVDITVHDGERSGSATVEVAMPERGANPEDLGSATYRIDLSPLETYRIPGTEVLDSFLPPDEQVQLLLHLGDPDLETGERTVTVGATGAGENEQDLCVPTEAWALPATMTDRHLVVPLSAGDRLPSGFGGVLAGGLLQADMRASGAALNSGSLLSQIDLPAVEDEFGMAPDELCEFLATFFGSGFCVPCSDPRDGTAGLTTCVTTVQEFDLAPATNEPLIPVSAADLPPECSEA